MDELPLVEKSLSSVDSLMLKQLVLDRIDVMSDLRETQAEMRWRGLLGRLIKFEEEYFGSQLKSEYVFTTEHGWHEARASAPVPASTPQAGSGNEEDEDEEENGG